MSDGSGGYHLSMPESRRLRIWLVVNEQAGSARAALADVLGAIGEVGNLVGRTDFPNAHLPVSEALEAVGAEVVAVLAGDGTINVVADTYRHWSGALLALPGGTMNMLCRMLHGNADAATVVARAAGAKRVSLPMVVAGERCGFVGLVVGPAASWNSARERLRQRHWRRLMRAIRYAWGRTWWNRTRLEGVPRPGQAFFIRPEKTSLVVTAVEVAEWTELAGVGLAWLRGDWTSADAATRVDRTRLRLSGSRSTPALIDGEPFHLHAGNVISLSSSNPMFLRTICE
ncbi:diacylglycerol/lipid kinase family protein [Sphingomonas sp. DT-51]|uniref:diacylglycerol/lipid kinase family protein n=1 Tax=Sphingomonas sp. DT-51 TaxID=3396165 RepID=UPI003F19B4C2